MLQQINIPQDQLEAFCRKWRITELALFGSVLRDDFCPESDVDVLVSFEPAANVSYFDWPEMQSELGAIFANRKIDLLTRPSVEKHHNPWMKHAILSECATIYRAA